MSLSEPHTSIVHVLHVCMLACLLVCLNRPLTVNFEWVYSNIYFTEIWLSTATCKYMYFRNESEGLLPDYSISVKEAGSKDDQVECACSTHRNLNVLPDKSMLHMGLKAVWQSRLWVTRWQTILWHCLLQGSTTHQQARLLIHTGIPLLAHGLSVKLYSMLVQPGQTAAVFLCGHQWLQYTWGSFSYSMKFA